MPAVFRHFLGQATVFIFVSFFLYLGHLLVQLLLPLCPVGTLLFILLSFIGICIFVSQNKFDLI